MTIPCQTVIISQLPNDDFHPSGYSLKWSDEFDTNTIGTNWYVHSSSDASHSYIQNGKLYLKSANPKNGYVKSGTSSSNRKRWGPYGYWAMKVRYNFLVNVNNQWWFSSDGWHEEVDFEYRRERTSSGIRGHHGWAMCGGSPAEGTNGCDCGDCWAPGINAYNKITDQNYHVLGWLWTPSKYEWYIDGAKVAEFTDASRISDSEMSMSIADCSPFTWSGCPMHGEGRKMEDPNGIDYMIAEYVRFYQE